MNVNFTVNLGNGEELEEAIDQLMLMREALYNTTDVETDDLTSEYLEESEDLPVAAKAFGDPDIDTSGAVIEKTIPASEGGTLDDTSNGVDLDDDKLPWDVRIHGANKLKTAKNLWKKIKNINKNKPGLVEKVEAELRKAMGATLPASKPVTANIPTEKELEMVEKVVIPVADPVIPNNSEQVAPIVIDFPGLLNKITTRVADVDKGIKFKELLDAKLAEHSFGSIQALIGRPDFVPTIDAELDIVWNTLN